DACPAPEREPERRRPELPPMPFLGPVPEAPGRFLLFFAPVDPVPEVCAPRGASGLDPFPLRAACELRDGPLSPSTSPRLSIVVRAPLRVAVPRERPPRLPPSSPTVSSPASRPRGAA